MPRKSRLHAILLDMMSRYLADGEPIAEGFFDSGVVFKTTLTDGVAHGNHTIIITACREGEDIPDAWITIEVDENFPE